MTRSPKQLLRGAGDIACRLSRASEMGRVAKIDAGFLYKLNRDPRTKGRERASFALVSRNASATMTQKHGVLTVASLPSNVTSDLKT